MRRSILYSAVSISLILILFISFAASGDSTDFESLCEELLMRRSQAWNKILEEDYDYDAFHCDMNSVASGKLLEEDLETFAYLKEYPTDMEPVISLDFQNAKIEKYGSNVLLEGEIIWDLEGQEGIEVIEGCYRVEMQKQNGSWYLSYFQSIEY
ncbi:hypothetical protein SDC9_163371 [bioreactor metagenome]|uniref:DUF4440 domain-containing protein n=1 Tax=bioreactor metagenome TaxID=1076179 RepID=A0A645FVE2_9ZZZZ|nr:hypothetical protein [Lutispora sp.]MEA4962167.1 hypothetical protein [Lutispora sp.]